jgi:DNA-binding transcriptional MerR regulator
MVNHAAVAIPEKLFFKIGEVCEICGVQAHVLRYWESEFPMLAPQKNRAGQRTYRKRDVEMALRVKELLYEDQYTIAGAKKKLASEMRGGASKLKVVAPEPPRPVHVASGPVRMTQAQPEPQIARSVEAAVSSRALTEDDRLAIKDLASQLKELLGLLEQGEGGDGPYKA